MSEWEGLINKCKNPPAISNLLRLVGCLIPNIKYVRTFHNRVLKPLNSLLGYKGPYVVNVMGVKMCLFPKECVDGNLYFAPHLYDRKELRFLMRVFPKDGVHVDCLQSEILKNNYELVLKGRNNWVFRRKF